MQQPPFVGMTELAVGAQRCLEHVGHGRADSGGRDHPVFNLKIVKKLTGQLRRRLPEMNKAGNRCDQAFVAGVDASEQITLHRLLRRNGMAEGIDPLIRRDQDGGGIDLISPQVCGEPSGDFTLAVTGADTEHHLFKGDGEFFTQKHVPVHFIGSQGVAQALDLCIHMGECAERHVHANFAHVRQDFFNQCRFCIRIPLVFQWLKV